MSRHNGVLTTLTFLGLLFSACSSVASQPDAFEVAELPLDVQEESTRVPPALDLDHHPLYWFAPLPPQPLGEYDGSDDFMDLFEPGAAWAAAASHLQVFKLYGGWAAREATIPMLSKAIADIRQRGLALAVELGPLNPEDGCGIYIEGFAGQEGVNTVHRINASGGDLNFIALDEPYYWAHFYDGPNACNWTAEKIARDVGTFISLVKKIFPDVIVGDIEPVTGPADASAYKEWLEVFREVNGYDLAFLHLDMDWNNPNWPQQAVEMETYRRELGIPVGMIYIGNAHDESDEVWLSVAGERVKRYEIETGGQPDHVIFQSWNDKPDQALPETEPYTYTWFVKTYFEDKSILGFSPEILANNLALNKPARFSNYLAGNEGEYAVDGDTGTLWNSGDDAPQWIEVDLGQEYSIGEIRLLVGQFPSGKTVHRLLGRGVDPGGQFVLLTSFEGNTDDGQWLTYSPNEPLHGIQFIRIETVSSPSWAAWREIEVIVAQ